MFEDYFNKAYVSFFTRLPLIYGEKYVIRLNRGLSNTYNSHMRNMNYKTFNFDWNCFYINIL
jgi:hypothetical protein